MAYEQWDDWEDMEHDWQPEWATMSWNEIEAQEAEIRALEAQGWIFTDVEVE